MHNANKGKTTSEEHLDNTGNTEDKAIEVLILKRKLQQEALIKIMTQMDKASPEVPTDYTGKKSRKTIL